jgi:hypothetical protein
MLEHLEALYDAAEVEAPATGRRLVAGPGTHEGPGVLVLHQQLHYLQPHCAMLQSTKLFVKKRA